MLPEEPLIGLTFSLIHSYTPAQVLTSVLVPWPLHHLIIHLNISIPFLYACLVTFIMCCTHFHTLQLISLKIQPGQFKINNKRSSCWKLLGVGVCETAKRMIAWWWSCVVLFLSFSHRVQEETTALITDWPCWIYERRHRFPQAKSKFFTVICLNYQIHHNSWATGPLFKTPADFQQFYHRNISVDKLLSGRESEKLWQIHSDYSS